MCECEQSSQKKLGKILATNTKNEKKVRKTKKRDFAGDISTPMGVNLNPVFPRTPSFHL